ncbi:CBO0543 family protein [Cohnella candidum]|uniref:CBO0543 family protein n=1 Tax=Cohnella candidum TaxID=2674991 RepID=UPI003B968F8B
MGIYARSNFKTHTESSLFYALTIHPCVVILFLGNYPIGKMKRFFWISFWILVYTVIEWIEVWQGILIYRNGWNLWWSIAFMGVVIPLVRLHYRRPLWAYGISIIVVFTLVGLFHVPLTK